MHKDVFTEKRAIIDKYTSADAQKNILAEAQKVQKAKKKLCTDVRKQMKNQLSYQARIIVSSLTNNIMQLIIAIGRYSKSRDREEIMSSFLNYVDNDDDMFFDCIDNNEEVLSTFLKSMHREDQLIATFCCNELLPQRTILMKLIANNRDFLLETVMDRRDRNNIVQHTFTELLGIVVRPNTAKKIVEALELYFSDDSVFGYCTPKEVKDYAIITRSKTKKTPTSNLEVEAVITDYIQQQETEQEETERDRKKRKAKEEERRKEAESAREENAEEALIDGSTEVGQEAVTKSLHSMAPVAIASLQSLKPIATAVDKEVEQEAVTDSVQPGQTFVERANENNNVMENQSNAVATAVDKEVEQEAVTDSVQPGQTFVERTASTLHFSIFCSFRT